MFILTTAGLVRLIYSEIVSILRWPWRLRRLLCVDDKQYLIENITVDNDHLSEQQRSGRERRRKFGSFISVKVMFSAKTRHDTAILSIRWQCRLKWIVQIKCDNCIVSGWVWLADISSSLWLNINRLPRVGASWGPTEADGRSPMWHHRWALFVCLDKTGWHHISHNGLVWTFLLWQEVGQQAVERKEMDEEHYAELCLDTILCCLLLLIWKSLDNVVSYWTETNWNNIWRPGKCQYIYDTMRQYDCCLYQ